MNQTPELIKLGKRIAELRNSKGLTQFELGARMGKNASSIGRVELGRSNPTFTYLLELAKGLEISVVELIGDIQL